MNTQKFVQDFAQTFLLVLAVSALVSYLYSLLVHGAGLVDWESSFRFALIFGIVFPAMKEIERRKKS